MNRFRFLLLLGVALGLASAMPAEGRPVARRTRVDLGHPECESEAHGAVAVTPPVSLRLATFAALPAEPPAAPRATTTEHARQRPALGLRAADAPAELARSRAPPVIG